MRFFDFFTKYKSIVIFLVIEFLALVSFGFANINEVFYIIASILSICAFVFSFVVNANKKEFCTLIPVIICLFIISGFAAFGGFSKSFTTISNIAVFFAIPSFFSLGFFIRRFENIKLEYILFAIGIGLALLTLVGTIATWVQYGPFYSLIHKSKPIYFYEGTMYNVTTEMNWLVGFKITEVSIEYGSTFAILCSVFLPASILLKATENKRYFILSLIIGSIGFISLVSIPNIKAIIILIIVSLFAFIYKYLKEKKIVINIFSLLIVCVTSLGLLFYLLTILNGAIGFKFSGIFEKIFASNSIIKPASHILEGAFATNLAGKPYNLFGFDLSNPSAPLVDLTGIVKTQSYIFEYEILKELGLVGTAFVLIFYISMFVFVVKYIRDSKDSAFIKNVIVMFLISFILISTFAFDCKPQPHDSNVYQAFLRSTPFMISLFLFGVIYSVPNKIQLKKVKNNMEETSL